MFETDGCVKASIKTEPYQVVLIQDCEHCKIVRVEITVMAKDYASAVRFVEGMRIPRTHVFGR
jgi:hypothetical protein